MKVFLIRGPRYYWRFMNEYDNFLLPQNLACLAAVLRENKVNVRVIHCSPLKMGWKSLRNLLEEEKPDVVGVGDSESLYAHEAIKVLQLSKEVNPRIITVAGGAHFGNLLKESLLKYPLDFIVLGEGEYTFLELIREVEKANPPLSPFDKGGLKGDFRRVKGIAFRENDNIIETPPRPLIENLDELPIPAYDLMPMHLYGKAKYLFTPGAITIHHSRGCMSACPFCGFWLQMAERKTEDGKVNLYPKWRTKSVERTIEEIKLLYHKYKKRYLMFVDGSWNVDPLWNEKFAEFLLRENLDLHWFAFMRADFILRDEKAGIFKKLVDSGLVHVAIGVERATNKDLKCIGKDFSSEEIIRECMSILRNKYPQVFIQATFMVGTRDETEESLLGVAKFAREICPDYAGFHPLTPVVGTKLYQEVKEKGWLEVQDFSQHDWITPVMGSKYLSREEIDYLIYQANRKFISLPWLLKGLLSPYRNKRNMYIWWLLVMGRIFLDTLKELLNPFNRKKYSQLLKPKWYDS